MEYDVVILGGGAAGLSAGIYSARGKMKTLLIEQKRTYGGQCATTTELENYPGYPEATGPGLMEKFREHSAKFGVEFQKGEVEKISIPSDGFLKAVTLKDGTSFTGKSVIIATGAEPRILGIKGEREFRGKGVSYCATCDADFFEDLDIVVVGSGNTAVEESLHLSKFVNSITMVILHREGVLDADKLSQEKAFANEKINFIWNSVVEEIVGDDLVKGVKVKNLKTGDITDIPCEGVFMFVGTVPQSGIVKELVQLTPRGHIVTGDKMDTSCPGIFAAGDVVDKFLWQVVTAAADGAIAAVAAGRYIEEEEYWREKVLHNEKRTIAMFWSPLDKRSVDLMGTLESLLVGGPINLATVDTYKNNFIAERYGVSTIPTLVVFEKGKEIIRKVNPSRGELDQLLEV